MSESSGVAFRASFQLLKRFWSDRTVRESISQREPFPGVSVPLTFASERRNFRTVRGSLSKRSASSLGVKADISLIPFCADRGDRFTIPSYLIPHTQSRPHFGQIDILISHEMSDVWTHILKPAGLARIHPKSDKVPEGGIPPWDASLGCFHEISDVSDKSPLSLESFLSDSGVFGGV